MMGGFIEAVSGIQGLADVVSDTMTETSSPSCLRIHLQIEERRCVVVCGHNNNRVVVVPMALVVRHGMSKGEVL